MKFMSYVRPIESGCWIWTGSTAYAGYGCFSFKGKTYRAHKWIYEQLNGPIHDGHELDHLCRVKSCINPIHLEEVTHKENMRRYYKISNPLHDTHCPNGHEFIDDNTFLYKGTFRRCRKCNAIKSRRYKK